MDQSLCFLSGETEVLAASAPFQTAFVVYIILFSAVSEAVDRKIIIVTNVIGAEIGAIRLIPLKYICTRKRRQYTVSDREQAYVVDSHILTERCLLFCCSAKYDLW